MSLHKTFTDCYFAEGFAGGYWATALNDENMNYYYLGWSTREVLKFAYMTCLLADLLHLLFQLHKEYSKTELFAVEIDKLKPHMDSGEADFMKLTQQLS